MTLRAFLILVRERALPRDDARPAISHDRR